MTHKRKWLNLLVLMMVLCGLVSGCTPKSEPPEELIGTWEGVQFHAENEITFNKDGTFSEFLMGQNITGTYSVDGNRITFRFSGTTMTYTFRITGEDITLSLILTYEGIDYPYGKRLSGYR